MRYQIEIEGSVVFLAGVVSIDQVLTLRRSLELKISETQERLTFDLSRLENAHSALLSLMLCLIRKAKTLNKEIRFTGMSQKLSSLASISQLTELSDDAFEIDG